jgi:hypothetical protein
MLWSEIKKWAKEQGYETIKQKDESVNGHSYYWTNINNPEVTGVSLSVSKLARDIYNSITDNQWIEHQTIYKTNKEIEKFNVSDY